MITPTIGRVVLVHRGAFATDQPEPAFITYVWNDRMVNLGGFDRNGHPFACTSVKLLQDDDPEPSEIESFAYWMPYQKAVAAGYIPPVQHETPKT